MSRYDLLPERDGAGSWGSHLRGTVLLGLPLIGAQLAQTALSTTNTLVLGQLGPDELAASVLGWQLFFIVWMFGCGFGFAVMPLVANALGRGDAQGVRRYVRMGLWISVAYALLLMLPLWQAERVLLALGQDAHLATLAGEYLRTLQWALFPQLAIIVLRSFLGALRRPGVVLMALLLGVALNAGLNLWWVFGGAGLPALGMAGSGLATFVATCGVTLFLIAYSGWQPALRVHGVFDGLLQPDRAALREVFWLGWPIGITVVAEVALFSATAVMMGWVGPLELAAHGITLQFSSLTFMIPLGLSAAATIRVGWACGRGDRRGAARAATAALGIGVGIACISATVFLSMPQVLAGLFLDLDDPYAATVLPVAVSFLAIAAAFQVVDSIQALSSGSLRGLRDARVPMLIALFSYWGVGMPLGYFLAFRAGWGGEGVWWGLAIGLATAAVLLTLRLVQQIRRMPPRPLAPPTPPAATP